MLRQKAPSLVEDGFRAALAECSPTRIRNHVMKALDALPQTQALLHG